MPGAAKVSGRRSTTSMKTPTTATIAATAKKISTRTCTGRVFRPDIQTVSGADGSRRRRAKKHEFRRRPEEGLKTCQKKSAAVIPSRTRDLLFRAIKKADLSANLAL